MKYRIVTHLPCTAEEYLVLKDDPEYVAFQLGVVGATEVSRVLKLGDDGFVTQTIVNRPNVVVPRIVRPLLRGSAIEFKDVRRFRDGTQRTVPFVAELSVSNSISDRVDQRGVITVRNVVVDDTGALRPAPPPPRDGEGEIDLSTPDLCASRVATGAVGGGCARSSAWERWRAAWGRSAESGGGGAQHARRVRSVPEDHGGVERRARGARARRDGWEDVDGSVGRGGIVEDARRGRRGEARRPRRRGGGDGDGDGDEETSRATRWWRALAPARVRTVLSRARESLAPGWGPGTPPGRDASKRGRGRDDITRPDDEYLF